MQHLRFLDIKDGLGHEPETVLERGLGRRIEPEDRVIFCVVAFRESDRRLRLAHPTHPTKYQPSLFRRQVTCSQSPPYLGYFRLSSDEECRLNVRRLTETESNRLPEAQVVFPPVDN